HWGAIAGADFFTTEVWTWRGLRVVQTPYQAPNANACAERFVRSIREECLHHVIPLGDRHLRRTLVEFVQHYHRERNHQGLENRLIADGRQPWAVGGIHYGRNLTPSSPHTVRVPQRECVRGTVRALDQGRV